MGSPWETGKTYILENLSIPDNVNLLVLSTRHSYSNAVTTRLDLKSYGRFAVKKDETTEKI